MDIIGQQAVQVGAQHTPGPWYAGHFTDPTSPCECRSILSETCCGAVAIIPKNNNLPVGEGGNDCPPENEAIANARLIAAAPDLLAACILLLRMIDEPAEEATGMERELRHVAEARAAIAKAEAAP